MNNEAVVAKSLLYQNGKLKLYNTITKNKDVFTVDPTEPVKWYCCGPTVYDKSHLGHARTYIAFDVLRRVMRDVFGYNILYIMNITDIDDKIIKGARYEKLFQEFESKAGAMSPSNLIHKVSEAIELYKKTQMLDFFTTETFGADFENTWKMKLKPDVDSAVAGLNVSIMCKAQSALHAAITHLKDKGTLPEDLLDNTKQVLCLWLDTQYGHTINDKKIFSAFAEKWEQEFTKDMITLNVEAPDVLTKVSEYILEIISFINVLVEKKHAYVLNGSVYFDIKYFNSVPNFKYAKLEPNAHDDSNLVSRAEGDLHQITGTKKSPGDFVLWKNSKPGEPAWKSPWGEGRPGWHIECSVMASDVAGSTLDIHSGGRDLAFPHHDNELAQSEECVLAYHNTSQWVKFFLHTGPLNIGGLKMSKSLKNFVTVQEILQKASPSKLRIMFLLTHWNQTFDYKEERLKEASFYETLIKNFLAKCKALLSQSHISSSNETTGPTKFKIKEYNLYSVLCKKKALVNAALCDNINTPTAMAVLRELVDTCNTYISEYESISLRPNLDVLNLVSNYVNNLMVLFGVFNKDILSESNSGTAVANDVIRSATYFSEFRDKIRKLSKMKYSHKRILQECDNVRDNVFHNLGIQLDDSDTGPALVKFVGKEAALEARNLRINKNAEVLVEKQLKKKHEQQRIAEKNSKAAIKPSEFFKTGEYAGMFLAWDQDGIPTKRADAEPISKSQGKKYAKLLAAHTRNHKAYLEKLQEHPVQ